MLILKSFKVVNFKNFKEINLEQLNNLTTLIGSNGVGKSNFLSIIDFISSAFHDGIEVYFSNKGIKFQDCIHQWNLENKISIVLRFEDKSTREDYSYQFTLEYDIKSGFNIIDEQFSNNNDGTHREYENQGLTSLNLKNSFDLSEPEQRVKNFLSQVVGYSFYNTSLFNSSLQFVNKSNNVYLLPNGENMSSLLYLLKSKYPVSYKRITDVLKLVIKPFEDFYFIEEGHNTVLKFKMQGLNYPVSIKSLSDGTIRFIILSLLLNLPINLRPNLVLLEEPEVALHPVAVNILGDLIESYSADSQIMIATQSPYLLDRLSISSIYILSINNKNETEVQHIDKEKLKDWLKKYSLSEIWLMSIFGGGPL